MPMAERNRGLQAEIVGMSSVFSFLTVHFYADGPSGPICRACDARQDTIAAFEAAILKAVRRGFMSDARLVHLSPPGNA
jgi:hypothetical protein